ncbi:hypothetical protein RvY_12542 [Ramazzottius varieornatus]|uniref:Uncharacterized protein n=1 Tax=Ramazzottius varieornatus TaxID=947166 RepID=A0A1D1VM50_RAMVA|nr:hypothetical protein RvY_12542 [Ramazzottius varieornatus]
MSCTTILPSAKLHRHLIRQSNQEPLNMDMAASPAPSRITRSRRKPATEAKLSSALTTLPSIKIPKVSSSASNKASLVSSSNAPPPSTMPPPRTPVPRVKVPAPRANKKLAIEKDVISTPSGISRGDHSLQPPRATPLQSGSSSRGNVAAVTATPHQAPSRMPSDNGLARKATITTETRGDNARVMATPSGQSQRSLRPPSTMTRVSRVNKSNLNALPHSFSGSTSQLRAKVPSQSGVDNVVPESDEVVGYVAEVHSEPANSHSVVPGPSALKKLKQPSLDDGPCLSHDVSPTAPPQAAVDTAALQSELLSLRDQLETERKLAAQIASQTEGLHQELSGFRNELVIKDKLLQTASAEKEVLDCQVAELEAGLRETLQSKERDLSERDRRCADIEQQYTSRIQTLESLVQALEKSLAEKVAELSRLDKSWGEAKGKAEKLDQQLKTVKAKHLAEVEELLSEKAALLKKTEEAEKEAASWHSALEIKTAEVRKLQTELADVRLHNERLTAVEKENANVKMKVEDLTVRNQALATTEKKLRSDMREKEEEIQVLSRRSTMLAQEKDALQFKLATPRVTGKAALKEEEEGANDADRSGSL